jgi:hypothetical protein
VKLYELSDAYRLVGRRIEDTEGDESGDDILFKAALDSIEDAIEGKAQAIIIMAKEWKLEAEGLKEEEERLAKRRKTLENRADGIRKYLLGQLLLAGIKKLKTKLFTVSVNPAKDSVIVDDVELLPPQFVRTKKEPEKALIKAALEDGQVLAGVRLETGQPSMTVR